MTNTAQTVRIPRIESSPIEIGNDRPLAFICGPCQLESRSHALETAEFLRDLFGRVGAPFIYKTSFDKANRSSLSTKRGAGLSTSAPIFEEIRTKLGVPVLTDVHLPEQCAEVAEVADVLQIPAFLCRQTDLLVAAAETGKPINVKKGQFLAPWDMKNVLGKITGSGNTNVMACERGAQGDRSGGERQFVPVLARAAVSIGVAAVFLEAHPDPDNAPSDGPNMVPFSELEDLVRDLMAFDRLAKQTPVAAE
jgi:2-dehydro-3-deoxyphosphooctonate aldolase (KDO 8-P synthase)